MKDLFSFTNELSQAPQRKDQDIVNAMNLIEACKQALQLMRDNGWETLLSKVYSFCANHEDDKFFIQGRSQRKAQGITNVHHYRIKVFYSVLDMQLQELNNRFNEVNTELLICLACLCPNESFVAFDKQKLIRLAELYPDDFSYLELMTLDSQLDVYILDMHSNIKFIGLKGIGDPAKMMVETKKDRVFPLVYLLIKLALILPVATASVERVFSTMNFVKNRLQNRMSDQWLNDSLVVYIEKDVFDSIDNEVIIQYFQKDKILSRTIINALVNENFINPKFMLMLI